MKSLIIIASIFLTSCQIYTIHTFSREIETSQGDTITRVTYDSAVFVSHSKGCKFTGCDKHTKIGDNLCKQHQTDANALLMTEDEWNRFDLRLTK